MSKHGVVVILIIGMLCVSMSGAAVSFNNEPDPVVETYPINLPTESPEVNTQVFEGITNAVDKYLSKEGGTFNIKNSEEFKNVQYPWSDRALSAGDFVDWIIFVDYNDNHFEKEVDITPREFLEMLDNPYYTKQIYFDVDENGLNDLRVDYNAYISQIYNAEEGISVSSIETCLDIDTSDIVDRTAKLEVLSEIRFNYGILTARSRDASTPLLEKFATLFAQLFERIKERIQNIKFRPFKNILEILLSRLQKSSERYSEPDIGILADEDDHINIGVGVASPAGETLPIYFTKRFAIAKENILKPIIFEHELEESSKEPLALIFGFQVIDGGTGSTEYDVSFSIEFDPAIYIRTQFIPRGGYVYYSFDGDSSNNGRTLVSFYSNILTLGADEENIEIVLVFDSTQSIASSGNWMSFDITKNPIGVEYKANTRFDIGLLVSSPVLSAKLKFVGIPVHIRSYLDFDFNVYVDPDVEFDADATASLNLEMSSDLDDIILYYPKLTSEEPDVEFIKVSDIPQDQVLEAHTDLYFYNGSMITAEGNAYVKLEMSSDLGDISVFYPKADPEDEDEICISIPNGFPGYQKVGATAKLYMDRDYFSNPDNNV